MNDPDTTTDKTIRFIWSDGASDGGSPITSYTVFYDQGASSTFIQLAAAITTKYY